MAKIAGGRIPKRYFKYRESSRNDNWYYIIIQDSSDLIEDFKTDCMRKKMEFKEISKSEYPYQITNQF